MIVNKHLLYTHSRDVLKSVNQIHVAEYYTGCKVNLHESIKSPLRDDPKPGCRYDIDKHDNLILFDYSRGKSYNIIQIVSEIKHITYREAKQEVIASFMHNGVDLTVNTLKFTPRDRMAINAIVDEVKEEDIEFWSIGDIKFTIRDFKFYNILPTNKYTINGNIINHKAYIFKQPKFIQVYRPDLSKESLGILGRYRSNTMLGLHSFRKFSNRDYIIITKSFKDAVYLDKLGFNVCYVIKEGHNFTSEQVEHLRSFKKVFVLFDNDITGKKNAEQAKELFNFIPIYYPIFKDTVDNIVNNGTEFVITYLNGEKIRNS